MLITQETAIPQLDALIVLGRGIDEQGRLSETGFERAEMAAHIARTALSPIVVVFTGARNWEQTMRGIKTPSEGRTMMNHALTQLGGVLPDGVVFVTEEDSTTTAENFANTKPILKELNCLSNDSRIGIMSDRLHFSEGRIQLLGSLALPGVHKLSLQLKDSSEPTPAQISSEKLATKLTRGFMTLVPYGDEKTMLKRHRKLEKLNRARVLITKKLGKFAGFHQPA